MTDQTPGADPAGAPGAAGQATGAEADTGCASCLGARGVLLAIGFAAFAAYVAADFASGGRLSAAVLGALAAARGRAAGDA